MTELRNAAAATATAAAAAETVYELYQDAFVLLEVFRNGLEVGVYLKLESTWDHRQKRQHAIMCFVIYDTILGDRFPYSFPVYKKRFMT